MFPNPIQRGGLLTIANVPLVKVKIVDMNGKMVQEVKGEGTLVIQLHALKAGTYMVCIEGKTQIWNKPLIVR